VGRLLVDKWGVVPLFCDITDDEDVERALDEVKPHVVLHLAGISNVDYCEDKSHWNEVMRVNFTGALNIFRACDERKIQVGFLSTEHVFSGKSFLGLGGGPYKETDPISNHTVNSYALSKLAAEGLRHTFPVVRVIRTSYLFDWVRLSTELTNKPRYDYPTFIHRSYMYLPHFAECLAWYAERIVNMPNVLHIAGSQTVSQYKFMDDFVRMFKPDIKITPRRTPWTASEAADRPHKAGLSTFRSRMMGMPQYDYWAGFNQMDRDVVRG
jgi:dTDP-4-dehydrorhamnose reductase